VGGDVELHPPQGHSENHIGERLGVAMTQKHVVASATNFLRPHPDFNGAFG
jgi:hypothetical protein